MPMAYSNAIKYDAHVFLTEIIKQKKNNIGLSVSQKLIKCILRLRMVLQTL